VGIIFQNAGHYFAFVGTARRATSLTILFFHSGQSGQARKHWRKRVPSRFSGLGTLGTKKEKGHDGPAYVARFSRRAFTNSAGVMRRMLEDIEGRLADLERAADQSNPGGRR
jgi:hypothetical protein